MSNGTKPWSPEVMRVRLHRLLETFHDEAHADERRLREAMREYERSMRKEISRRAA